MIVAAAPQLLDHPCCDVINSFPWGFFLAVHITLFALGAYFAARSFGVNERLFGWGFGLFALAEVSYMTYHVNITQFLFAHTISEVLSAVAFTLIFVAATRKAIVSWTAPAPRSSSDRVGAER